MCSPAIVFMILKISHVFSRYRPIAGRHIKNRPHTLQCFADFLQNVFGGFSRLSVQSPPPIPSQFIILTYFSDLCSSGPVSQTQNGDRIGGIKYDAPPPPICLESAKIYEKVTKNCSRLSMCSTGIEKKSYMCQPGIEFLTPTYVLQDPSQIFRLIHLQPQWS
jgi:hypothetical protein